MSQETLDPTEPSLVDGARSTTALEDQEVTMRGDLEQISLSDIFQTLSMSKMEGVLRVRNPLEQHDLYFRDGFVRCLVKNRKETRRLGQRLLQCGLIDRDTLRHALSRQQDTNQPLGQVLVSQGALTKDQIDEVVSYYQAEDIYSLFLWEQGDFEFYKGASLDAGLHERFAILPDHECGSVLLEVARRSDEWNVILEEVSSVDEILAPRVDADPSRLEGDALVVFSALDGRRSIRELAEATQLALFDCARAARDLAAWGMVEIAPAMLMVEAAAAQLERNEPKRAVVTLRTLMERGFDLGDGMLREVADLLERCGESRLAGQCLLSRAKQTDDPIERLELARESARLDSRSANVFAFLQQTLREQEVYDQDELMEVTHQLADAYEAERREEDAIHALTQLEEDAADHPGTTGRLARLYARAGESERAIAELELLAEHYAEDNKRERLTAVYEQILKLDSTRRDIQKALKASRISEEQKRRRRIGLAAAILLSVGGAYAIYSHQAATAYRDDRLGEVRKALQGGQLGNATSLLAALREELGEDRMLKDLADRIETARKKAVETVRQEKAATVQKRLGEAANAMQRGELVAAIGTYSELWQQRAGNPLIEKAVRNRLVGLRPLLEERLRTLPHALPDAPASTQSQHARKAAIAAIRREFVDSDRKLAQAVPDFLEAELTKVVLKDLERQKLAECAEKIRDLYRQATERLDAYLLAEQRESIEQSLQPLFERARTQETEYDFAGALASYRELASRYSVDNELRQHFAAQSERLERIVTAIEQLDGAAEAGEFETARDLLRVLVRTEPGVPFESMLSLPLRVQTQPPGAIVRVNNRPIGTTPLIARYKPALQTSIRVTLDGFEPVERTVHGDAIGSVSIALAKSAAWTFECSGSVSQRTRFDVRSNTLWIADRSGNLCALDAKTGEFRWEFESQDLSGLLSTPWIDGRQVIVTSIDGPLRGLDRSTGKLTWSVDELHSEAPPVVIDRMVYAMIEDACVLVHADQHREIARIPLPGTVRTTPIAAGRWLTAATGNGHVVTIDTKKRAIAWDHEIGQRIVAAPTRIGSRVIAATDEGQLVCFDQSTGAEAWRRSIDAEVTLDLTVVGDRLIVPTLDAIRTFSQAGSPGPSYDAGAILSTAPAAVGPLLYLGTRANRMLVIDGNSLKLHFEVRGERPPTAAAGQLSATGDAVVIFGREVRGVERAN